MSFTRNNRQKRKPGSKDNSRSQSRPKQTKPAEKKGSIFDLKSQTGETTEIATSAKNFSASAGLSKEKRGEVPRKRYRAMFFETFQEALEQKEAILSEKAQCDQLNIVIHAEGDMYRTPLRELGKVFAGEAWFLIHKRRSDDGWYSDLQE